MDTLLYESVLDRCRFLEGMRETKLSQREKTYREVQVLTDSDALLEKSEKVLKHLVDKLATKDLTQMDRMVTYGLKAVFSDIDMRFESSLEERGKKIRVKLRTLFDKNEVDEECRCSIDVVESLILRVLCIRKLKKAPLMLLDETFSAVDSDYVGNLSELLSELAKKLGMDILLVTHNPALSDAADNMYRISYKDNQNGIEKIK